MLVASKYFHPEIVDKLLEYHADVAYQNEVKLFNAIFWRLKNNHVAQTGSNALMLLLDSFAKEQKYSREILIQTIDKLVSREPRILTMKNTVTTNSNYLQIIAFIDFLCSGMQRGESFETYASRIGISYYHQQGENCNTGTTAA